MTVEADINALNTTVTNLDTEIKVDKAKLDAMEADAEALKTDASTYSTLASDYATEASTLKTAAQAYSTSIGSASPIVDLTALAESKADTALALFIYDTSKDSDGGAWRYKTQGTSWYNETLNTSTRGSRREFPAVALLVADSTKITIYDADDPSLPMWKVISEAAAGGETTAIKMLNGLMVFGQYVPGQLGYASNRFETWDFIRDLVRSNGVNAAAYNGLNKDPIATARVAEPNGYLNGGYNVNCHGGVYDVDLTILPGTPIDSVTGMPRPTIALARYQGISVVHYDDTVVNFSNLRTVSKYVEFNEAGQLYGSFSGDLYGTYGGYIRIDDLSASISYPTYADGANEPYYLNSFSPLNIGLDNRVWFTRQGSTPTSLKVIPNGFVAEHGNNAERGFSIVHWPSGKTSADIMAHFVGSTYASGWLWGDIKFAGLNSTSAGALTETGNLIVNGDFEDGLTGWSNSPNQPTISSVVNGEAVIELGETPSFGYPHIEQVIPTVTGHTYVAYADLTSRPTAAYLFFSKSDSSGFGGPNTVHLITSSGIGTHSNTFIATSNQTYIHPGVNAYATGEYITVDNVLVKEISPDSTYNKNHLDIKGRITRTPVAEGAELMGYSGFSADNYLEMPYTADLDFGTDDFSYMIWIKTVDTYGNIVFWSDADGLRRNALITTAGNIYFSTYDGSASFVSGPNIMTNEWTHVVATRHGGSSGLMELYVNGELAASATNPVRNSSSADQSAKVWVGVDRLEGNPINASLALLRISGTIPTAEQIRKIYEDERVLFQPGAKCTLVGSNRTIYGFGYDSDTDHLHVATYDNRQTFKGLRRVDQNNTAATVGISAAKGMVIDE